MPRRRRARQSRILLYDPVRLIHPTALTRIEGAPAIPTLKSIGGLPFTLEIRNSLQECARNSVISNRIKRVTADFRSLSLVKLTALMERSSGRPAIKIGLIDGPVLLSHSDLSKNIQELSTKTKNGESRDSGAFGHGTFIAGILLAKKTLPLRPFVRTARCLYGPLW